MQPAPASTSKHERSLSLLPLLVQLELHWREGPAQRPRWHEIGVQAWGDVKRGARRGVITHERRTDTAEGKLRGDASWDGKFELLWDLLRGSHAPAAGARRGRAAAALAAALGLPLLLRLAALRL